MIPSTDTVRRVLDLIDEEGEQLEIGGRRRRARRLRRRQARRARRQARRQARDQRQVSRQDDRAARQEARQDARLQRQETVREGRADRQEARQDLRQQARDLRAQRGQLDEEPEAEAEDLDELEEMVDDDVEDMADLADELVDEEVVEAAQERLDGIAGDLRAGRIPPRRALHEARRTRVEARRVLERYDRGRPERRHALRRRVVQAMQGQVSGFGAEPTCAACTEAYGRALVAGLELAGEQARVELGLGPLAVFKKAGNKVAAATRRLADKNASRPNRAIEERQREGGRKLLNVFRKKGPAVGSPGEVEIGPHIRMRAVGGLAGMVLDLGEGMYLVTAVPPATDARQLKARMLGVGARQIQALQSPVGLLRGA